MTHRCTIITRLYTSEGIVGEVYNGDEFETQAEVLRIINEEIAPKLIGMDAFNTEGCWRAMLPSTYNILRDRKLGTCAPWPASTARIWDAVGKALDVPLYKLWGGFTDTLPIVCIAGYYEEGKTLADFGREMEQIRAAGFAGCKFKVGGRTPQEDADRVRTARSAAGDDFVLTIDANQGYTLRQAVDFSTPRRRPEHPLVRGAGPLVQRPHRHGLGPEHDRHPGLRRAERDRPRRLPRPDDGGRDRRLQFRRELGRRGRPNGAVSPALPPPSGSRWATTRSPRSRPISSLRSPMPPIWKPFIRTAIPCSTRSSPTARPS